MNKIKALMLILLTALALGGCVNVDSSLSFKGGKVTPKTTLKVGADFIKLDNAANILVKDRVLSELLQEEQQEVCQILVNDNHLKDGIENIAVVTGGISDKALICELIRPSVDVSTLQEPGITVSYNNSDQSYNVWIDFAKVIENVNDKTQHLDPQMLAKSGGEAFLTLSFTSVGPITFNEIPVTENAPIAGVDVTDDSIIINLLEVTDGNLQVTASDTTGREWISALVIFLVAALLLGTFFRIQDMKMRNRGIF